MILQKNYKINEDNTIDVKGEVILSRYPESELPSYIQFGKVRDSFYLTGSKLETLKGCPKEIGKFFVCNNCGYESGKWLGKCPACNEWNTFFEEN